MIAIKSSTAQSERNTAETHVRINNGEKNRRRRAVKLNYLIILVVAAFIASPACSYLSKPSYEELGEEFESCVESTGKILMRKECQLIWDKIISHSEHNKSLVFKG